MDMWGSASAVYKPSMINRWLFNSQLTFYTTVPFLTINPALQKLASALAKNALEASGENLKYDFCPL